MKAAMSGSWHYEDKPYATWELSNNSAEIRRVKERINSLTRQKETGYIGWEFEGGKAEANTQDNRLQIFFDGKPDAAVREELKSSGFRWSPKAGVWQRQLNDNAYYAVNKVKAIAPLTGENPTELQRAHRKEQEAVAQQAAGAEPAEEVRRHERIEEEYVANRYEAPEQPKEAPEEGGQQETRREEKEGSVKETEWKTTGRRYQSVNGEMRRTWNGKFPE